jgi:hypothetical protein
MASDTLGLAKKKKADEFYTQLVDIESELRHYKEQFKGKIILCNCDDPYESNFFKYFSMNFNHLGLRKLIATCYTGSPVAWTQLSLFDIEPLENGTGEDRKPYKIEISEVTDENKDGAIDLSDVEYLLKNKKNVLTKLQGDGDFRSKECIELLDEADIVVTNPPFSLFREYVTQLVEHGKQFLIIGNQNAITYKDIFMLLKDNLVWLGADNGGTKWFRVPDDYDIKTESRKKIENGIKYFSMGQIMWFTNLDLAKRHETLTLYKKYSPDEYPTYDNYDAIEVPKVADIPMDYSGAMGVPITFLDKYNPNQFEILGITKTWYGAANKTYPPQIQVNKNGSKSKNTVTKLNDGATIKVASPPIGETYYIVENEYYIQLYARVLIKNREMGNENRA